MQLRISKFDIEMFHHESWKFHLFGCQKVEGQDYESQKHCRRGSLHSCECWLLLLVIQILLDISCSSFFSVAVYLYPGYIQFTRHHGCKDTNRSPTFAQQFVAALSSGVLPDVISIKHISRPNYQQQTPKSAHTRYHNDITV